MFPVWSLHYDSVAVEDRGGKMSEGREAEGECEGGGGGAEAKKKENRTEGETSMDNVIRAS